MIDISASFITLPYKWPVPVRGTIISENRFLKINFLEVDYYISVLPGFHEATLEEILFKLKLFFSKYTFNFKDVNFSRKFFNLVEMDDFLLSIHGETLFNIETLLLGMIKRTHPELFGTNSVLENDLYRADRGPSAYVDSKCLKIKIAPGSLDKCTRLITELHRVNSDLVLRLDGNKRFDLNEMIDFEEKLKKNISVISFEKIDYIEEPFKNFSDTFLFKKRACLNIAMDESFSSYINLADGNFPNDIPAVIKPSLFGISTIHNWMQNHAKNRTIISSSFEHPSVKIGLVLLAAKRPSEFHGLENFF